MKFLTPIVIVIVILLGALVSNINAQSSSQGNSIININFAGLLGNNGQTGSCSVSGSGSGTTCTPNTGTSPEDGIFADGSLDTSGLPKFGSLWGGKYPHVHPMAANIFDPVPTRAFGMKKENESFYVEKLWSPDSSPSNVQGVYFGTDGSYSNMFVITSTSVIVCDAPAASGYPWAYEAVRSITNLPVSHFIYSHFHWDHNGLAKQFLLPNMNDNNGGTGQRVTFIAHAATQQFLQSYKDPARPIANITFESTYDLTVGGHTLNLVYNGLFHETGNVFIYHAVAKVLMHVDVVFPRWVPFERFGYAGDLNKYRLAHVAILSYDFQKFIGGHVGRWGDRTDVQESLNYYDSVKLAASYAVQEGQNVAGKFAMTGNAWAYAFKLWDYQSLLCYNRIYYQWRGILAGVDTWGYTHCATMCEDARISLAN